MSHLQRPPDIPRFQMGPVLSRHQGHTPFCLAVAAVFSGSKQRKLFHRLSPTVRPSETVRGLPLAA